MTTSLDWLQQILGGGQLAAGPGALGMLQREIDPWTGAPVGAAPVAKGGEVQNPLTDVRGIGDLSRLTGLLPWYEQPAMDVAMGFAPGGGVGSIRKVPGLLRNEMGGTGGDWRSIATGRILDAVDKADHGAYALRITEDPVTVGSRLKPSYIWENGERTKNLLPGTSAVRIEGNNATAIERALKNAGIGGDGPNGVYFGKNVSLIGGDILEYGDDIGEVILKNPKVLDVFEKAGLGPEPLKFD